MEISIRAVKPEFEGTACVAVQGSLEPFRAQGVGSVEPGFKDAYVNLRSGERRYGAILKSLSTAAESSLDADASLLCDLACGPGSHVTIEALKPVQATAVSVAISKNEFDPVTITSLLRTYLARQPLSVGQVKPIFLFTGEKITARILKVHPADAAILSATTELKLEAGNETAPVGGLDEVGGLEAEKKLIRERVLLPLAHPEFFAAHGIRPPRGILLCGAPGCGKTMIARTLSGEIRANFVELSGSEVFNPLYGESERAIREAFAKARAKTPAIILIDEIDALGGSRSAMRGELERRLVTTLLTEMDGLKSLGNVIVVATTNNPEVLDAALRRPGRFDYEVHIGVPDRKGRRDILAKLTRHMRLANDVDLDEIARRTHGFVGADLMLACRESAFEALGARGALDDLNAKPQAISDLFIQAADFDRALNRVKPSALREFAVEVPAGLSWQEVGGLSGVKDTLIQEIVRVLRDPESFQAVGVKPVRGVLLYGPPGTGKTLLARVIAREAEANFISVKGPEVLSKWIGESEQRIRTLFNKARESAPCIIFFDEIDAITPSRGKSVSDAADRVVNQLLTEMDGFENSRHVCVIAATNRMELIDQALLRPGRFDYHVMVPLPDDRGIEEIYKIHLRSKPLGDVDICKLVEPSRGFSGAHIAEICRRAALAAFRESDYAPERTVVTIGHLLDAIELVRESAGSLERRKIGFSSDREGYR